MITDRLYGLTRLHFLLKLAGGYALYWALVWILHLFVYYEDLLPEKYLLVSALIPIAAIVEFLAREKSRRSLCGLSRKEVSAISQREILFMLTAVFGVLVMGQNADLSRLFLALYVLTYSSWITWMNQIGHRVLQRRLFRTGRRSSASTVIVAPPSKIREDTAMHMSGSLPGAEVLGYVSYGGGAAALDAPGFPFPLLGDFSNVGQICRDCGARLLLALGLEERPEIIRPLQEICDSLGMRLIWMDDKADRFRGNLDSHQSGSSFFVTNWREPLEDPGNRVMKRAFDLVFSGMVIALAMPLLMAFVWVLHRIYSPGPLFYQQPRTGRNGEIFPMLKFRSMHCNDTPGAQAKDGDPRIFPGGNLIRRTSIDEIPQFFNVLKGQMSVVGPRPHFTDHDEQFSEIVGDYSVRQFAKPGITGLAQVKGCRGETDTERKVRQRVRLDHFYLRHWSLLFDVCIVCDTAVQMVFPPDSAR